VLDNIRRYHKIENDAQWLVDTLQQGKWDELRSKAVIEWKRVDQRRAYAVGLAQQEKAPR
jgi:hypothetical protein